MWRLLVAGVLLLSLAGLLVGCGGTTRVDSGPTVGAADEAAVTANSTVVTLTAIADTTLYEGSPGSNYGTLLRLYCGNYPDGSKRRALVRFDLSKIPATATVNKATLSVHPYAVYQGQDQYRVHKVTKAWDEGKATWTNAASAYSATASATKTIKPAMQGRIVKVNVTALARDWVGSPAGNHGLLLRGSEGTAHLGIVCDSRENLTPNDRPRLIVDYTP